MMEFPSLLGGERSLLSVITHLRQCYEFYLFAPGHGLLADHIKTAGLNHIPFNFRNEQGIRKSDEELLDELHPVLAKIDCSLVHGNSVSMARFLGRHRERFSQPVTSHLRDIMNLSAKAIQDISRLDQLIAVSAATADSYRNQGIDSNRIEVVYNGVDADSFPEGSPLNLHQELNLSCSVRFAVTVGQIGLRKGHDVLVEAIPQIAESHPDWHFLIIGERHSTKAESRLHVERMLQLLKESGNDHRVHWLGYRNDVAQLIDQADLLIHPSRQEPFGRVLLEAASLGKAIIATDVGGTSEMLVHRKSAWLIPPGDAVAIEESCLKLMADAGLRTRLGNEAKQRIRGRFSSEKSARDLALIWERFL